jgi:hypothetical protein
VSLTSSCLVCDRPAEPDLGLCPGCIALQKGNPVRMFAESADLTLQEIADAAEVSCRTVMRAAKGERISGKAALKIARVIDVNVRDLLVEPTAGRGTNDEEEAE